MKVTTEEYLRVFNQVCDEERKKKGWFPISSKFGPVFLMIVIFGLMAVYGEDLTHYFGISKGWGYDKLLAFFFVFGVAVFSFMIGYMQDESFNQRNKRLLEETTRRIEELP